MAQCVPRPAAILVNAATAGVYIRGREGTVLPKVIKTEDTLPEVWDRKGHNKEERNPVTHYVSIIQMISTLRKISQRLLELYVCCNL